jgi:hypothetical protein
LELDKIEKEDWDIAGDIDFERPLDHITAIKGLEGNK